jgi:hypothetical protein
MSAAASDSSAVVTSQTKRSELFAINPALARPYWRALGPVRAG